MYHRYSRRWGRSGGLHRLNCPIDSRRLLDTRRLYKPDGCIAWNHERVEPVSRRFACD